MSRVLRLHGFSIRAFFETDQFLNYLSKASAHLYIINADLAELSVLQANSVIGAGKNHLLFTTASLDRSNELIKLYPSLTILIKPFGMSNLLDAVDQALNRGLL